MGVSRSAESDEEARYAIDWPSMNPTRPLRIFQGDKHETQQPEKKRKASADRFMEPLNSSFLPPMTNLLSAPPRTRQTAIPLGIGIKTKISHPILLDNNNNNGSTLSLMIAHFVHNMGTIREEQEERDGQYIGLLSLEG